MVAIIKKKIFKGETPLEELQQEFTDELKGIMKDAAIKLQCSPEELRCRVDNLGQVEVIRMTPDEMNEKDEQRRIALRKKEIRRIKGI